MGVSRGSPSGCPTCSASPPLLQHGMGCVLPGASPATCPQSCRWTPCCCRGRWRCWSRWGCAGGWHAGGCGAGLVVLGGCCLQSLCCCYCCLLWGQGKAAAGAHVGTTAGQRLVGMRAGVELGALASRTDLGGESTRAQLGCAWQKECPTARFILHAWDADECCHRSAPMQVGEYGFALQLAAQVCSGGGVRGSSGCSMVICGRVLRSWVCGACRWAAWRGL